MQKLAQMAPAASLHAASPLWGGIIGVATLVCVLLLARLSAGSEGVSVVAVDSAGVVLTGLTKRAAKTILAARTPEHTAVPGPADA